MNSSLRNRFFRPRSPKSMEQQIAPHILSPDAALAEPIIFEVARSATNEELPAIQAQFSVLPCLRVPANLWTSAAALGQRRRMGSSLASLDLLIAAVAIRPDAQIITFARDFESLASACPLRVKLLS